MRRLTCGLVITAIAALATSVAFAGDRELAQQIVTNLEKSNELNNPDIGVQVKNGIAGLIGSVKTSEELAIVDRIVRDTEGVRYVINKLEVFMPELVSQASAAPIQLQPGSLGQAVESSLKVLPASRRYPTANSNSSATVNPAGSSPVRPAVELRRLPIPGLVSQASAAPIPLQPGSLGKAAESSVIIRPAPRRDSTANSNSAASANSAGSSPVRPTPEFRHVPRTLTVRPAAALRRLPNTSLRQVPRQVPRQILVVTPSATSPLQGPRQGFVSMPSPLPLAIGQNGNGAVQQPIPAYMPGTGGITPVRYNRPHLPNYAWPTYAPYPNYGSVTYPKQYSPTAWPYIGPFYPYPQVPLGWRKVQLEWDDGWWMLDFKQ